MCAIIKVSYSCNHSKLRIEHCNECPKPAGPPQNGIYAESQIVAYRLECLEDMLIRKTMEWRQSAIKCPNWTLPEDNEHEEKTTCKDEDGALCPGGTDKGRYTEVHCVHMYGKDGEHVRVKGFREGTRESLIFKWNRIQWWCKRRWDRLRGRKEAQKEGFRQGQQKLDNAMRAIVSQWKSSAAAAESRRGMHDLYRNGASLTNDDQLGQGR